MLPMFAGQSVFMLSLWDVRKAFESHIPAWALFAFVGVLLIIAVGVLVFKGGNKW